MASLEDALKKAGLAAETAAAETSEPKKPADAAEVHAGGSKSATSSTNQAPEVVEERPCTKCGTVFLPKLAKHRLCPKCAEEHFTAAKAEKSDKPAGERPARPRKLLGWAWLRGREP